MREILSQEIPIIPGLIKAQTGQKNASNPSNWKNNFLSANIYIRCIHKIIPWKYFPIFNQSQCLSKPYIQSFTVKMNHSSMNFRK